MAHSYSLEEVSILFDIHQENIKNFKIPMPITAMEALELDRIKKNTFLIDYRLITDWHYGYHIINNPEKMKISVIKNSNIRSQWLEYIFNTGGVWMKSVKFNYRMGLLV